MKPLFKQADYDKISDDLCMLGFNTVLRFNVVLSKGTQEGKRYHYHHEYEYNTNKYIDTKSLITIRRQFDFYLSIENFRQNEFGQKEFIMIRIQDILYVREQLQNAIKWFRSSKYSNLYGMKDNKTILLRSVEPIHILGLAGDKYISLEPSVISYEEGKSFSALRMYLSSKENYIDMSIDKFMGFVYLIESINMYESAQLLLNYLQRPEYGTNLHSFSSGKNISDIEEEGYIDTKVNNRKIENNKRQKSFFDKMNEL